ncbi:ABC-type transport system, involved in lipoprotein release, permease component [Croceitalea dokdonensis DOKDO 023]|uniref:ABC-type transport system, involved in lipoprotein release, permease component n=1 Tax=Croceitalea dokdonensis DOKDO 023 TaxID=1300341 RepID=A0A0N8H3L3_9FLAO|nr:FtsX-like permease family protein [Croceitalea dokdonensis]KPM30892.1 ABC-type transport system, involved in lipoprotein release, permease component [Croceitalea dokdonensis DOKDO 023]
MNFSFYIAQRYIRSKSSQNAINIINFITFLVIVIGAAALFIVLSAFAGLKTFSLQFTNTFDPDLKATPATGKFFSISAEQERLLGELDGLAHFAKELEERVYLSHNNKNAIAFIKGIDSDYSKVTGLKKALYYGEWNSNPQEVVVGRGIVNLLGLSIGTFQKPLSIITLKGGTGSITSDALNSKSFYEQMRGIVTGVYAVEENLDKSYVFAHLNTVREFLDKTENDVSALSFKLEETADQERIKAEITQIMGKGLVLKTRRELNSTLYRMLNTENLATYLIFTLVLVIALFNVVGAIIMMILDKQQHLKTLSALGATLKQLRRIYFLQGLLVSVFGGIIGVAIGGLLVVSQLWLEWIKITPSLAYPVEFKIMNVLTVLATILILGFLSSKIASSRISPKLVQQL